MYRNRYGYRKGLSVAERASIAPECQPAVFGDAPIWRVCEIEVPEAKINICINYSRDGIPEVKTIFACTIIEPTYTFTERRP